MSYNICQECRICKCNDLIDVIDLGEQIITSRFPLYGDFSTSSTPIVLSLCKNCSLVQLKYNANSSELYEHEYGYRSGISNTMRSHLKEYQEEILSKINLVKGDVIVDIGSNDSTMLQYYDSSLKRIGVDPTGKQFKEFYGDVELIPNYFNYNNFTSVYGGTKVKVVSSISMFYDLPDPLQFAKDIYNILDDNGIWTCEQSYIIKMIKTNSVDTICHEHLEYYSLTAVKYISDFANMKIIDIKFNECNGGSFRIYFAKKDSKLYSECSELINEILQEEEIYQIKNPELYKKFIENCDYQVKKLKKFINCIKKNEKIIHIYGASTKGNCLLQYAGLGEESIKYAVERNMSKIGKMTSTGIEIISEETMRKNPPDYLLVLPWHFREEIIERENEYLENGGKLIFPFPNFEIYSKKKKVLITGCDGMIARYVMEKYNHESVYGFSRKIRDISNDNDITKFYFDLQNKEELELNLDIIKPDIIIHLAGITSSGEAFNNPLTAINTNGIIVANICDIIHRNRWNTKLFNSSSSEIYKGHIDYEVNEGDNNMFHCHPYSIGKIVGHSIVDFYRNNFDLPFSNGILFTIESKYKNENFLLSKISKHANKWKTQPDTEPLLLGQLESYRTLLHASDAASAIKIIVDQEKGDNYLICGDENMKVFDMVLKIYNKFDINIKLQDNKLYDLKNDKIVAIIENVNKGFDTVLTNITGKRTKLDNLGWKPVFSINDIIDEYLLI